MRPLNEDYPLYEVPRVDTYAEVLEATRERCGAKIALEDLNATPIARVTYAELVDLVSRFGRALRRLGLAERDHVAILAENRVQWGIAYLATVTANLVAVPIDKSLQENEIVTILHASDAKAVVYSEATRDTVLTLAHAARDVRYLVDMDLAEREGRVHSMTAMIDGEPAAGRGAFPATDPDAVAVIVFTSGSMGRAKGVMLSQRNVTANLQGMLSMVELYPEDRFLSVLPLHHTYECTCGFLCPLLVGASVHYARSLKTVVEDLQRVRATILLAVPLLYEKMYRRVTAALADHALGAVLAPSLRAAARLGEALGMAEARRKVFRKVHEKFGGAIRIFIAGGAAPDPEVAAGLRALGFTMLQGYGLTETAPILTLNRLRKFRDDAAGLPLPTVEVRIAEPDAEGSGEIIARGPTVMLGYYKDDAATRAAIRDGWFYTGDLGSFDADGFLHITGRRKNLIVARNGKNVAPEEIEEQVNRIPFVLESAVYGARAADGDEEICVAVVPNAEEFVRHAERLGTAVNSDLVEKVIDREIRALNRKLPPHKQIRRIRIRETEFAKTTTQKIRRHLIHEEQDRSPAITA
jgi:long-chain acyl-CoA synthetase